MRPLLLILLLLALGATVASAAERGPTPLHPVAAHAVGVDSDGERWVIVTSRTGPSSFRYDVYDTWTGARSTLPEGCGLGGIVEQTTTMIAGRALLDCGTTYAVIELATAKVTPLPQAISDGRRSAVGPAFYILGRRWVWAEGSCGRAGEDAVFCDMYVDIRTGEARLFPGLGDYRDLDDPRLGRRRLCRPRLALGYGGGTLNAYRRWYTRSHFIGRRGLYRCRDGRLLLPLGSGAEPDLVGGLLSSGDSLRPRPNARVLVYDIGRDRLYRWRLPRVGNRRRVAGRPVHTRCEVFVATSLGWTDDSIVDDVRVDRARLPEPRDPRCRA